ncbi:RNA polymerase II mediator complex subunit [Metarhizium rileyi]|uniref:RNA polymerase II mediator complex subunit n=1 Tax=Metarhizium rileyi (strain RCEF 4871) TaxID=1649241 RepID=A0A5C6FY92_METRR|nr:RNA polymerase II mediator complex subunit [Metarhizium rileyi]
MTSMQSIASYIANNFTLQLLLIGGLLVAYPFGSIVYNIYFHPLSKFPGPKSWAATYVPYIKALLNSNLVGAFSDMHRKYGDIVRVGPNEISFATEEAWREIYGYRPGHKEAIKDSTWYLAPAGAPQNVLTSTDPVVRARMRKCLSHSLNESALNDQSAIIERYADVLISQLRDRASRREPMPDGALINMTDWIIFFTFDVIGDLAFGETFRCLETSDYHPWVTTSFSFLKGMTFAGASRLYPRIGSFAERFLIPPSIMRLQRQYVDFAAERVNRRLNLETSRPDFMTPFLKNNSDFKHMSRGEIESTFTVLIIAGSETTATVLCGTLNYLAKETDKLELLERAVRKQFQSEEEISMATTKDIPYLNLVVDEGLRLCLPIAGGLPRVVPAGGETYVGHYFPGGTRISIRPALLHMSARYIESPHEFHPERWLPLDQRPPQFANDNHAAVKPFSTGPTGCAGKMLALAELRLILARLVWAFDISLDPNRVLDWTKLKTMFVVEKEPMFLRLKMRSV